MHTNKNEETTTRRDESAHCSWPGDLCPAMRVRAEGKGTNCPWLSILSARHALSPQRQGVNGGRSMR